MRHPLRSVIDLVRSKWWTIGWLVAVAAFLAHVAALTLRPLSFAQAVLAGGFVLLAVLAALLGSSSAAGSGSGSSWWRFHALLGLTGWSSGGAHTDYSASVTIFLRALRSRWGRC